MKVLFVLPFLIMGVLATDFHSIAVRMLSNSTMCNNDSLVKVKEEILTLTDTERFNASALSGTRWLGLNKDEIAPETIFECVLTFFENDQSPLCKYLAHENIDDFVTFLGVMFDSFRYHPQLNLYARHAFEGKGYSISHPPIYTHLETARFFSLYCRHPISSELSLERIYILFEYSHLKLFSCPELQTRLNELFARKKFRRAIEKMESNSARMYELFYNHLFSDENLMFKVFDYLVERKEFDQELRFKQFLSSTRPFFKYDEFLGILFVNSLMNYQFDISKIYLFTSPLVENEKERDEFFLTLLFLVTLKHPNFDYPLKFDQFSKACNEYFFYISSIFNSHDDYLIADNLIRQFRRVKCVTFNFPPIQVIEVAEKCDKFINRIAIVYGIDTNAVEEEFPLEFQRTQKGNEQLNQFFDFLNNLIENTKWK